MAISATRDPVQFGGCHRLPGAMCCGTHRQAVIDRCRLMRLPPRHPPPPRPPSAFHKAMEENGPPDRAVSRCSLIVVWRVRLKAVSSFASLSCLSAGGFEGAVGCPLSSSTPRDAPLTFLGWGRARAATQLYRPAGAFGAHPIAVAAVLPQQSSWRAPLSPDLCELVCNAILPCHWRALRARVLAAPEDALHWHDLVHKRWYFFPITVRTPPPPTTRQLPSPSHPRASPCRCHVATLPHPGPHHSLSDEGVREAPDYATKQAGTVRDTGQPGVDCGGHTLR